MNDDMATIQLRVSKSDIAKSLNQQVYMSAKHPLLSPLMISASLLSLYPPTCRTHWVNVYFKKPCAESSSCSWTRYCLKNVSKPTQGLFNLLILRLFLQPIGKSKVVYMVRQSKPTTPQYFMGQQTFHLPLVYTREVHVSHLEHKTNV